MQYGSPEFYRRLLDHLYDGVYYVDKSGRITFWNEAAAAITGFGAAEVAGRRCRDNLLRHVDAQGNVLCLSGCPLSATLQDGQPRSASVFLHHKDGHRLPVSVRISPITDEQGAIIGAVEVFNDNTATLAALERLKELEARVYLDGLTGVANRVYLQSFLEARFNELGRHGWTFGLLFADIDHFKRVNDLFGHQAGDRVLAMVARTLANNLRSFDLVARWGGEEFVCIIAHVATPALLREMGERLRQLIEHSFIAVNGHTLTVTISMGGILALAGDTPDILIARADALLYRSKIEGRNRLTLD